MRRKKADRVGGRADGRVVERIGRQANEFKGLDRRTSRQGRARWTDERTGVDSGQTGGQADGGKLAARTSGRVDGGDGVVDGRTGGWGQTGYVDGQMS